MKRIFVTFARNTVFANIVLVLIFMAGAMAVTFMKRELFPDFSMDEISIEVAWPGAVPDEVEEGIVRKIEEALEGMEGIREYETKSEENGGSALITVQSGYETSDVLDRVRNRVGGISTFPRDAEEPVITELMHRTEVMKIFLSGNMSERTLREWAFRVKDELRVLPGVSQIETAGVRDHEIGIEVSERRLREFGMSFDDIAEAVSAANLNLSAGTIHSKSKDIRVRTMERKYNGKDFAKIVVKAGPDGEMVTLDRVAEIRDGFTENFNAVSANGEKAVILAIYKTREEDALSISEAVRSHIEKEQARTPDGAKIEVFFDATEDLRSRIDLLVKNGLMGLCLVLLLLWMFLDIRLSFWAGMGIPVSILGALVIVWAMGGTINMLSLFGLITVLGIVVDDAIVVGEAVFHHRKRGLPPLAAAVEGIREVGMPVFAAVLTTIVAFIPFALVGDIIGKFMAVLPAVVIPCLVVSMVECLFLLPAHLGHGRKNGENRPNRRFEPIHRYTGKALEWFIGHAYLPFLTRCLQWRYISLCAAVCVLFLSLGLVLGGIVKFEALPESDGHLITSGVRFPAGTPATVTQRAVNRIESALHEVSGRMKTRSGEPLLKGSLTVVGKTFGEGSEEDDDDAETGRNVGGVQAVLLESDKRGIVMKKILDEWKTATGPIPGAESLTFEGVSDGPPGDPIEAWLRGHDTETMLAAANELMDRLRRIEGASQVRTDYSPGIDELRLSLKPEARTLGLTVNDLADQARSGFYGREALRLQRGRDDVRVKVRYSGDERTRVSSLRNMRIRTGDGREIPLSSVAEIGFSSGCASITRVDGMKLIRVIADVDEDIADSDEIISDLEENFLPGLSARYPGLEVSFEGEEKHMKEAIGGLVVGFPLAMAAIFVIVATMFRSYVQPFTVLFTVPFGIIGGIIGHLVLGYDLSLMSVFGMVALSGVVVNDAIVLVERVNRNLASGMEFIEAVQKAGARRFRAIFLTTISTVGGLAPLIMETSLQAKFMIPMAISISAGLVFATLLTLVMLPATLVVLNDFRLLFHRIGNGVWPKREAVEPAVSRNNEFEEAELFAEMPAMKILKKPISAPQIEAA